MKYFLFVFLIPTLCFSQEKKDSKIVVATDSNAFNSTCLYLLEHGYTLKQKDKELGFIMTNDRTIKGTVIRLKFLVKDTSIAVTGDLYNDLAAALTRSSLANDIAKDEKYYTPINNIGMKNSGSRDAWNEMLEVAKHLGTNLTFSK